MDIEERILRLEEGMMHRERLVEQLNEVVYEQSVSIEALTTKVEELQRQLKSVSPGLAVMPEDDSPPPHY
jgi:uncharacterized coiled-coil protein SlyX